MTENLAQFVRLTEFLGSAIPGLYEYILYDLTEKDMPIAVRKNRNQKSEKCTRKLVEDALAGKASAENGMMLNQMNVAEGERMLKTSVFFIKNEKGEPEGALCVNMDCQLLFRMYGVIDQMLNFNVDEVRYKNTEPSLELLEQVIKDFSPDPKRLTFDERTELICDLYELGVFDVKGSVAKASELLGVSDKSLYRYISKIKSARSL